MPDVGGPVSSAGEAGDAGAFWDHILMETGATPSQFERAKGFIRDVKATAEWKAFLPCRGTYVIPASFRPGRQRRQRQGSIWRNGHSRTVGLAGPKVRERRFRGQ